MIDGYSRIILRVIMRLYVESTILHHILFSKSILQLIVTWITIIVAFPDPTVSSLPYIPLSTYANAWRKHNKRPKNFWIFFSLIFISCADEFPFFSDKNFKKEVEDMKEVINPEVKRGDIPVREKKKIERLLNMYTRINLGKTFYLMMFLFTTSSSWINSIHSNLIKSFSFQYNRRNFILFNFISFHCISFNQI